MEQGQAKASAASGSGTLLLEVWEHRTDGGQSLTSLEFAGPRGHASRAHLPPSARLLTTIRASSHYEAMTRYYSLMGWGTYTTAQPSDYEPYPEEWVEEQRNAGLKPS
jgi:hypothetical protein